MHRRTILLIIAIATLAPFSSGTDTSRLSDAIHNLEGKEAAFTQRFLPRGYKKEQVESGTVIFGAAPASRWTYVSPEPKTFVFDGTTSWMYVPADESVLVHRVGEAEKNRLPFFVLSDPDKLRDWYEIDESGNRTKLEARNPDALLRSIEIKVDDSGRVASLEYVDGQGNRTLFELSEWRAAESSADTFTFAPPPGVDVIHN